MNRKTVNLHPMNVQSLEPKTMSREAPNPPTSSNPEQISPSSPSPGPDLEREAPGHLNPDLGKLARLMERLRAPDGCPWDHAQTAQSLRAYVLEEAHEVAAAIDAGDLEQLAGELGDLLFQVVFLAQIGREQGVFDLQTVIDRIHTKMVERHPHVFGDRAAADARAVHQAWERRKLEQAGADRRSLLAGVPTSLPALVAAYRMTQKAAGVGFDWPDAAPVLAKVREELGELEAAGVGPEPPLDPAAVVEELGDLLFTVTNLARHLAVDPEAALAQSNRKFRRRFAALETEFAARGRSLADATLAELDAGWEVVKAAERAQQ